MTKPTKRKRSEPEDAGEGIVVSEVMLRRAALAYAAVAHLDTSDPRWRRCWRALRLAAIGMVAEIRDAAGPPEGHPPSRALVSRRSAAPPMLRRLAAL
ncbi:MAG TPA: hypothetical protein VFA20_27850 [Myxococcaceae bacterium]|nr:hypothetical protein [Myxococcaceae bacterium]